MKIVKFEAVQDEFIRLTPRTMTIEGVMRKIADGLIAAVQNEGKGKGRAGKVFSFNAQKAKVFLRIKYGTMEAYCLESAAKTVNEANEQVLAYAEALKSGSISATEKEAIKKVFNARKERMEEARAGRKAKTKIAG
jgi:predicted ArsR family transcriptional regulator